MVSFQQCSPALLLASLALLACLHEGDAIQCYECNSHNDSNCANEKPPDTLLKDCSEHIEGTKYIMCRKIVQYIDFEVNGNEPEKRVIRGCGWKDSAYTNKCYSRSGFGGRQEVCSCIVDKCNGAATAAASLLAAVAAALALRAL